MPLATGGFRAGFIILARTFDDRSRCRRKQRRALATIQKRLQDFADQSGLEITVSHYPPGTSKWNPIEHRLFSQMTATWAGYVLSTLTVLLGFIRRTTTRTGLKVTATHLDKSYQTGQKVSRAEFKTIQLTRHATCPQWNYTIRPRAAHQARSSSWTGA